MRMRRISRERENANKVEIWIACRKFIEQELKEGRATQFKDIFPNWKPTAHVGVFWTWGNDDNLNWFDYLVDADNLTLSSKNLYENWGYVRTCRGGDHGTIPHATAAAATKNFMFILNNQN